MQGGGLARAGATLRRTAAAMRARPRAAAATAAAVMVGVLAAGAAWLAGGPEDNVVATPVLAAPPPADDRGDVRRGRCANCGFVVGIRALQPAGFEFTVRMRDGSMRTSTATSRGTWHIGDAVMLMGDAASTGR